MQTIPSSEQDRKLWQQFVDQANAYEQARQAFFQQCQNRVQLMREALYDPAQRRIALNFFEYLNLDERNSLFNDLIRLASVGHSDIELVRQAILSFSKKYLLDNIESSAEEILKNATDEEYRRLLELYTNIHISLVTQLMKRASNNHDPDIQEVGEDFQEYLTKSPVYNHSFVDPSLIKKSFDRRAKRTSHKSLIKTQCTTKKDEIRVTVPIPENLINQDQKTSYTVTGEVIV